MIKRVFAIVLVFSLALFGGVEKYDKQISSKKSRLIKQKRRKSTTL